MGSFEDNATIFLSVVCFLLFSFDDDGASLNCLLDAGGLLCRRMGVLHEATVPRLWGPPPHGSTHLFSDVCIVVHHVRAYYLWDIGNSWYQVSLQLATLKSLSWATCGLSVLVVMCCSHQCTLFNVFSVSRFSASVSCAGVWCCQRCWSWWLSSYHFTLGTLCCQMCAMVSSNCRIEALHI